MMMFQLVMICFVYLSELSHIEIGWKAEGDLVELGGGFYLQEQGDSPFAKRGPEPILTIDLYGTPINGRKK